MSRRWAGLLFASMGLLLLALMGLGATWRQYSAGVQRIPAPEALLAPRPEAPEPELNCASRPGSQKPGRYFDLIHIAHNYQYREWLRVDVLVRNNCNVPLMAAVRLLVYDRQGALLATSPGEYLLGPLEPGQTARLDQGVLQTRQPVRADAEVRVYGAAVGGGQWPVASRQ